MVVFAIVLVYFFRAMLCISAAYAVMRCLCVTVCVSVTFMDHVQTNEDIFDNQDNEMFVTRSLDVTPKPTEQRI